jgi:hypothetical protein
LLERSVPSPQPLSHEWERGVFHHWSGREVSPLPVRERVRERGVFHHHMEREESPLPCRERARERVWDNQPLGNRLLVA